jgi:hypothetical protein
LFQNIGQNTEIFSILGHTPHNSLEINQRLRETCHRCLMLGFLLGLFFDPEDGSEMLL